MTIKKGRDLSLLFRWSLNKFEHKNAQARVGAFDARRSSNADHSPKNTKIAREGTQKRRRL